MSSAKLISCLRNLHEFSGTPTNQPGSESRTWDSALAQETSTLVYPHSLRSEAASFSGTVRIVTTGKLDQVCCDTSSFFELPGARKLARRNQPRVIDVLAEQGSEFRQEQPCVVIASVGSENANPPNVVLPICGLALRPV